MSCNYYQFFDIFIFNVSWFLVLLSQLKNLKWSSLFFRNSILLVVELVIWLTSSIGSEICVPISNISLRVIGPLHLELEPPKLQKSLNSFWVVFPQLWGTVGRDPHTFWYIGPNSPTPGPIFKKIYQKLGVVRRNFW